ncbi:MAG: chorismate lyase [Usitatibacter sp.]
MTRWRHLAPPHTDAWRPWLTYPGSLTRRIVAHSRRFEVEVVARRWRFPNDDEFRVLGRPAHKLAYVREVVLRADGEPVVMAHSIVSRTDLRGVWRPVAGLGARPLAEVLFADRRVHRGRFEFARIGPRHPLGVRARQLLGRTVGTLRARRSLFHLRGRPLMVTEVFLPGLLELRP